MDPSTARDSILTAPPDIWLTSARLTDGSTVDVLTGDGVVRRVVPAGGAATDQHALARAAADGRRTPRVDLTGYLLLAAPAEPHAHLDKSGTWDEIGPGSGELLDAVRAWERWSARREREDIVLRADRTLALLVAHGASAVRTHAAIHPEEEQPSAVSALMELRERWRHRVRVQVVAMLSPRTPDGAAKRAIEAGADLLGGSPHRADDPGAEVRRLFDLAEALEVGLDVHTDESLTPSVHTLPLLADLVLSRGFPFPVTASHCVSLGQLPAPTVGRTAERLARAGIGVVTLPITNLYLQGRGLHPVPRGLTAVGDLLAHGVVVAGGGDNVADPFNPMGRADPLETASLLVTAAHLSVAEAWAAVSDAARRVLGLAPAGPAPGMVADLLAVRASGLAEAIGQATEDRMLFTAGRQVSKVTVRRELY
ncbi:amidohydrolase family protein [Streptomyces sp. NPDC056519]|uniref:amidohydrolase family protein n=1 Tax=Streptomyces sp. NPDC056519 TaxID=3345849 RepID=UPI0036AC3A00